MPAWPIELSQYLRVDFSEAPVGGVIRSQPDTGPSKPRRRFTRTRRMLSGSITIPNDLYPRFLQFYDLEIAGGAIAFDWVHPITRAPARFLFAADPTIAARGPLYVTLAAELEEL